MKTPAPSPGLPSVSPLEMLLEDPSGTSRRGVPSEYGARKRARGKGSVESPDVSAEAAASPLEDRVGKTFLERFREYLAWGREHAYCEKELKGQWKRARNLTTKQAFANCDWYLGKRRMVFVVNIGNEAVKVYKATFDEDRITIDDKEFASPAELDGYLFRRESLNW